MFPVVRIRDKCTVFTLNIQIPSILSIFMEIFFFGADPISVGVASALAFSCLLNIL